MNARELRAQRAQWLARMKVLLDRAELEARDFSPSEQSEYDSLTTKVHEFDAEIRRQELTPPPPVPDRISGRGPTYIRSGLGDSEERSLCAYFRSGNINDLGGIGSEDKDSAVTIQVPTIERRATDQIMNIAAAEDGGAAVPTGFSRRIAARQAESDLAVKLGCFKVPGQGTTVNFPYENADAVVLATTSEQVDNLSNTYERDRPTLATKAFTLVKKTKKIELTEELLEDEDAGLMTFIENHIGRSIALTHNTMLLTEVAANGTALKTFASASVIAAGEIEDICYNDTLAYYLDSNSVSWVLRPATLGEIRKLTGNSRLYAEQALGSAVRTLLDYPYSYSSIPATTTASGKSVYFGNWEAVGFREPRGLSFIRDPYTTDGIVYLKYSFRCCFGVLAAAGIGYGVHPSA